MSTINHIATNFQPNPEYKPPKQLQTNETQCLREILGLYRLPIVTAVAQILHGIHGQWQKIVCGVLCFVKDSDRRLYLLQVFDLRSRTCIYEETAFVTTRLEKCTDVFYTFNGINCKVGINFVDRDDAQTFFHHFQKKQEARQIRKTQRANLPVTPAPDTKAPDSTVKASEKKSFAKRFFTIGRKEGAKVEISSPLHHTFDHRNGITIDGYVFKDEDCLKLFQTVLSDMNLTAEDKEYIQQDFVKNKDGFKEFVQKKNISSGDPAVSNENRDSPSTMPSAGHSVNIGGNKHVRRPFQDITTPSFTHFQTPSVSHPQSKADIPPPIPPRGRAQAPVSSPWPKSPSTLEPVIPTPASGPSVIPPAPPLPPVIPPAPPLPPVIPPAPPLPPVDSAILKIPRPIENDSLPPETKPDKAKSDTPKARTWLDDIVDNRPVLKQVPIVTEQPPPVKAQKTMEDYIREKIEERRKALMGRNNGEEEAETDGDDGFSD